MWKDAIKHYLIMMRNSDNFLIMVFLNMFLAFPLVISLFEEINPDFLYLIHTFPFLLFLPLILLLYWEEEINFSLSYILSNRKIISKGITDGLGIGLVLLIYYISDFLILTYKIGLNYAVTTLVALLFSVLYIIISNTYFSVFAAKKHVLKGEKKFLLNLFILVIFSFVITIFNLQILQFFI